MAWLICRFPTGQKVVDLGDKLAKVADLKAALQPHGLLEAYVTWGDKPTGLEPLGPSLPETLDLKMGFEFGFVR